MRINIGLNMVNLEFLLIYEVNYVVRRIDLVLARLDQADYGLL